MLQITFHSVFPKEYLDANSSARGRKHAANLEAHDLLQDKSWSCIVCSLLFFKCPFLRCHVVMLTTTGAG